MFGQQSKRLRMKARRWSNKSVSVPSSKAIWWEEQQLKKAGRRMYRKGLAILMRTRMRAPADSPTVNLPTPPPTSSSSIDSGKEVDSSSTQHPEHFDSHVARDVSSSFHKHCSSNNREESVELVQESMHKAIFMNKTEIIDTCLGDFSQGYCRLSQENKTKVLLMLAAEYSVDRARIRELMQQYLGIELPGSDKFQQSGLDDEGLLSALYRTEKNLRQAIKPMYEILFERLNTHPGGLKFLSGLRADLLSMLKEENLAALRALDSYLKEKLITWLSPAALELHHITWDDPASLLEKIVVYEAVHPISNLLDLKRRLGIGRRCFGYLHPALPGEPLIFIEVALLKNVARSIQEVLWEDPPAPETEATCALFYSISSTQPGLAGINLGKFLIKRVVELLKKEMPHVYTFATLSPIPGFTQWLTAKLASQSKLAESETKGSISLQEASVGGTFREDVLLPEEDKAITESFGELASRKTGMEIMLNLLTSTDYEWARSAMLSEVLQAPLMRLCMRYLCKEKKRGKALDSVANFHLQNGAIIGRLNWMADRSEKGLRQSTGIMVNYIYRLDKIEENARLYFGTGHVETLSDFSTGS